MSVENGLGRAFRAVGTEYVPKNAKNIPYLRHGQSTRTQISYQYRVPNGTLSTLYSKARIAEKKVLASILYPIIFMDFQENG